MNLRETEAEEEVSFEEAFGDDIDTLNKDVDDTDILGNQIRQLLDATMAIQSFGINPGTMAVMKTTGLLSGTSLDAIALEQLNAEGPESAESQMALEALTDKIKETTKKWSAKILDISHKGFDKLKGILDSLWEKITISAKKLTSFAWDKAKATGRMIKAHPFATVAAVVGAVASVAAIVAFVGGGISGPYANETAMQSFVYKVRDMIDKIKWPFGKITTEVTHNGSKIVCHIDKVKTSGLNTTEVAKLGWSQTAVKSITGKLSQSFNALKKGLYLVGLNTTHAMDKTIITGIKLGDKVGSKTEKIFGEGVGVYASVATFYAYFLMVFYAMRVLVVLLTKLVVEAFRAIILTFSRLSHALSPEPA